MKLENIEVKWKGHAGVFISSNGKNIYIDPYKLENVSEEKADIILLTHSHYDHCSVEDLRKVSKDGTVIVCPADCQSKLTRINNEIDIQIANYGEEKEIQGIAIKPFPAYNPDKDFHGKEEGWCGYIIRMGEKVIYHAGDTDIIPEMSELENYNIDLAFLPIGGTYTMNADEASRAVVLIRPKLAIPIHYGEVIGSEEDAERFVQLVKEEDSGELDAKVFQKE